MTESSLQRESLERQAYAARSRLARVVGELQYRRERLLERVQRVERGAAFVLAIAVGTGMLSVSYFLLRRRRSRAWIVPDRAFRRRRPFRDALFLGVLGAFVSLSRYASMQPRSVSRVLPPFPEGVQSPSHDRPHL